MQLSLSISGTVSTNPAPGKSVDYENVDVTWLIDFQINPEGFIEATIINIPQVTVYNYTEQDEPIPQELQLYVKPKKVKLKGQSPNLTLVPRTFKYNSKNESLILEYF
jgi:hypothetical protein